MLAEDSNHAISKSNISSINIDTTIIGEKSKIFYVFIAVLKLTELDLLFSTESSKQFKGHTADFPVIYFQRGNTTPYYVGDARDYYCGEYRLARNFVKSKKNIGAIQKFKVTGAFDINDDGILDIIEINRGITYYITPSGELFVMQTPEGC
jgi:hypothetical protein